MNETRNPIDKTGRANTREVGVLGATIVIGIVSLQQIFGEDETEVGTIDKMTITIGEGGGSSKKW